MSEKVRLPHRSTFDQPARCEFCGMSWKTVAKTMKHGRIQNCAVRVVNWKLGEIPKERDA